MKKIFTTIGFLIFTAVSFAQYGSGGLYDARSIGIANTYNAISRGVDAIGINPANIVLSGDHSVVLGTLLPLPFASVRAGSNIMSINDLNYFFGGVDSSARLLTDADKQRFNDLFSNGGTVYADVSLNLFSIVYKVNDKVGAFGFGINDFIAARLQIPSSISDLALNGNELGKVYDLSSTQIKSWWLRYYSLTYAREFSGNKLFESLAAGISLKYVTGFSYIGTESINSSIQTQNDNQINVVANSKSLSSFSDNFAVKYDFQKSDSNKTSSASIFPSPAGEGFGLDIGLNFKMNERLNISIAVTDIGSITWTKNTAQFVSSGSYTFNDLASKDQLDSLKNKIVGKADSTGSFSTSLATAFRLGFSYALLSNLFVAADFNQGFNDQPGNSTSPRVSFGTEWKPMNWLPLIRTGFSFGGNLGFQWGVGLGINVGLIDINLATSNFQTIIAPNSAKYASVSFNTRWKF